MDSTCWFTSHMSATARAGTNRSHSTEPNWTPNTWVALPSQDMLAGSQLRIRAAGTPASSPIRVPKRWLIYHNACPYDIYIYIFKFIQETGPERETIRWECSHPLVYFPNTCDGQLNPDRPCEGKGPDCLICHLPPHRPHASRKLQWDIRARIPTKALQYWTRAS